MMDRSDAEAETPLGVKIGFCLMFFLLIVAALTGCAPTATLDQSANPAAESHGNAYSDPNLYIVELLVGGDTYNHTELHGSGSAYSYGGYGAGSFTVWQDGKGLAYGKLLSMEPSTPLMKPGDNVIIKGEDLKVSIWQPGWIVTVKCRMDYEPVTNLNVRNEVVDAELTQTWELDRCRMETPAFRVAE